jgi:hypothetical protein
MSPRPASDSSITPPHSAAIGVLALACALAGCVQPVGPARTAEDYELKAADTAETVVSAVRTAQIAVDVAARGRAFPPYVSVLLDNAEGDANGAAATFGSIQPPGRESDHLRDELDELLVDATGTLASLRITARRADLSALPALAEPLEGVASELEAFAEAHG